MQPDGGLRIAIAMFRARKARSCFMRLLIAQPLDLDLHRFCSGHVLMLGGPLFEGHW